MPYTSSAPLDDPTGETEAVLTRFTTWEVALAAVSRLAVVFALALALVLIVGHQLGQPI